MKIIPQRDYSLASLARYTLRGRFNRLILFRKLIAILSTLTRNTRSHFSIVTLIRDYSLASLARYPLRGRFNRLIYLRNAQIYLFSTLFALSIKLDHEQGGKQKTTLSRGFYQSVAEKEGFEPPDP